ncbi:hypothetical protein vseg_003976 [Gypsophila vaccaria]
MKLQQLGFQINFNCNSILHLKLIHAQILRQFNHHHHHHHNQSTLYQFNNSIKNSSKNPNLCINSLHMYRYLVRNNIKPDNYTYPVLLNSCSSLRDRDHGVEVHCRIVKSGFCSVIEVFNALIDMYGKCGDFGSARHVFDEMPMRDLVSYNAVLGAYAKAGRGMECAEGVFDAMPVRNLISWNAMVVGYVNSGDLSSARAVFDTMFERDAVTWTTILVGYTKKGMMDLARTIFDDMPDKTLVCWTAMISGFAQNRRANDALMYFRRMQETRVKPDALTMTAVISALAQLGRPELANWITSLVCRERIERNERVLTALADMHAKCGNIEEACELFDEIRKPDMFAYSALITGLASNGHGIRALEVFHRMLAVKIEPDCVTFVGVLSACRHAGLVEDGLKYWDRMINEYKIEPNADHYGCIIDMLGRAGRLEHAFRLLQSLPVGPRPEALGSLLAACRTFNNVEIAELVAKELFALEPENTGNYVLLSGIYAAREQWEMAARVRSVMKEKISTKLPGWSMLDFN